MLTARAHGVCTCGLWHREDDAEEVTVSMSIRSTVLLTVTKGCAFWPSACQAPERPHFSSWVGVGRFYSYLINSYLVAHFELFLAFDFLLFWTI